MTLQGNTWRCVTSSGADWFQVPYKVPDDGPAGAMLRAMGRHAWRPAHLHFMIEAEGYELLITHLFEKDGEYLLEDAVFAVLESLIVEWPESRDEEEAARLGFAKVPFSTITHDFFLSAKAGSSL
eukprot:SAG11_NODE_3224_length_2600_cov_3.746901_2_plen_125_part_00